MWEQETQHYDFMKYDITAEKQRQRIASNLDLSVGFGTIMLAGAAGITIYSYIHNQFAETRTEYDESLTEVATLTKTIQGLDEVTETLEAKGASEQTLTGLRQAQADVETEHAIATVNHNLIDYNRSLDEGLSLGVSVVAILACVGVGFKASQSIKKWGGKRIELETKPAVATLEQSQ